MVCQAKRDQLFAKLKGTNGLLRETNGVPKLRGTNGVPS